MGHSELCTSADRARPVSNEGEDAASHGRLLAVVAGYSSGGPVERFRATFIAPIPTAASQMLCQR